MEIAIVEGGPAPESLPIENVDDLVLPGEQPLRPELLEAAVDVHRRQPEGLAELGLPPGTVETMFEFIDVDEGRIKPNAK